MPSLGAGAGVERMRAQMASQEHTDDETAKMLSSMSDSQRAAVQKMFESLQGHSSAEIQQILRNFPQQGVSNPRASQNLMYSHNMFSMGATPTPTSLSMANLQQQFAAASHLQQQQQQHQHAAAAAASAAAMAASAVGAPNAQQQQMAALFGAAMPGAAATSTPMHAQSLYGTMNAQQQPQFVNQFQGSSPMPSDAMPFRWA